MAVREKKSEADLKKHKPLASSQSKKLTLHPLKFEQTVKDLLKVKPKIKSQALSL